MKKIKKIVVLLLALAMSIGLLSACGGSGGDNGGDADKGKLKIGYVNWAEGIAMSNLAAVILEDKMGYDVDLTMADVAPLFTSLASGNTDIFLDTWLPVTHEGYLEEYGDDIEEVTTIYEGARIGLVVPSYVEIDTIEELNANKDDFNGQIIGIDSGAGIMGATEDAIVEYDLDLDLITGSGPAMTAALKKAIDNNEAIAVTGWTPHWMFGSFDLKFLEDSKEVYGEAENIFTYSRKGFAEDMPELQKFFEGYTFTDEVLSDLMGAIADSDMEAEDAAREWMNNNEDIVNGWLE